MAGGRKDSPGQLFLFPSADAPASTPPHSSTSSTTRNSHPTPAAVVVKTPCAGQTPDTKINDNLQKSPTLESRPYQQRITSRAIALFRGQATNSEGHLEREASSVLIESPTGSGKTVMGLTVARFMQKELGMSVGWAAMRRNLLAQAADENARHFGLDLQLISMFEKRPQHVDLLVVDEAQHDAAMTMANLHCNINPRKVLGLTATPFRGDRFRLCFDAAIHDAGIHNLIQEGYLSTFHHFTIPLYTPKAVAEAYVREADRWGQTLIFFHRYAQCLQCATELAAGGVKAHVVTAQTDREQQIEDFAAGRMRVLISMLILGEGFDCPSLQTVFCRPSGRLCSIQMCGRVLRKHHGLPFKQIVQCDQTRHPFHRTATPAEQYLWSEGGWRSLTLNRRIEAMCQRMQQLVVSSRVVLPKMLSARPRIPEDRFRRRPDAVVAQVAPRWPHGGN